MRTMERWLIKLAVIQCIILLIVQFSMHEMGMFKGLNKLLIYEGVIEQPVPETLDIFRQDSK